MKAKDLFSKDGELKHKLRSHVDLINHIGTREKGASNYSLLLGAGASVTSGIRTATQLIEEWKVDLYKRERGDDADLSVLEEFYEKECSSWFNPINPYSSLFEKRYDLPSQRRRFIEQEVDGKLPSIGYAYLTALMDADYVNTVFTTNFDDLLNEAFYHFSNKRPIYCAHDSSVHSISITSKRPKILKLHGDYLFDDIKSTLRETESLEQNIKDKMIEFCKEYGLIVVGYSGCDRSIMDVLDFLAKQENYLKNGVYWCLREDDEVNHQLRNLLWKDRVYPVIIDGFDEFFAKTHSELVSSTLDIENNLKQSKVRRTIEDIVSDKPRLSRNVVIAKDIESIKQVNIRSDIGKFIGGPDSDNSDLSISDIRNLMEVDSHIGKIDLEKAYSLCETFKEQSEPSSAPRYIKKLIEISDRQGRSNVAKRWCNELLMIDKYDIENNLLVAKFKTGPKDRYAYLKALVEDVKHSSDVYREASNSGFKLIKNDPVDSGVKLLDIEEFLEKSINIDPSMRNRSWLLKYDLLEYKVDSLSGEEEELEGFVKDIYGKHPESISASRLMGIYAIRKRSRGDLANVLDCLYKMHLVSSRNRIKSVDDALRSLVDSALVREGFEGASLLAKSFFDDHTVEDESCEYLISKSEYILFFNKNVDGAKGLLEKAVEHREASSNVSSLFDLSLNLSTIPSADFSVDFKKILELLEDAKISISEEYYYLIRHNLSLRNSNFSDAHGEIDKSYDFGLSLGSYLTSKSYLFLVEEEYEKLIDFAEGYSDKIDRIPEEDLFPVILNKEFAKKKLGKEIDKTKLMNIVSRAKGKDSVKACALRILGRDNEAKPMLRSKIDENAKNFCHYSRWPILSGKFIEEFNPFIGGGVVQKMRVAKT